MILGAFGPSTQNDGEGNPFLKGSLRVQVHGLLKSGSVQTVCFSGHPFLWF